MALAERLENRSTEKSNILVSFNLADDKDMKEIRKWIEQQEATIQTLTALQDRCEQKLNHALEECEALSTHASSFDPNTLWLERLKKRETLTNEAKNSLQAHFGTDYSKNA